MKLQKRMDYRKNNDNKEENKVEVQEENSLDGLAVYQEEEDANYKLCEDMEGITFKCPSNYTSVGKSSSQPIYMDPDVPGASVNVFLFEKLGMFHGMFHVLDGLISPLDGSV